MLRLGSAQRPALDLQGARLTYAPSIPLGRLVWDALVTPRYPPPVVRAEAIASASSRVSATRVHRPERAWLSKAAPNTSTRPLRFASDTAVSGRLIERESPPEERSSQKMPPPSTPAITPTTRERNSHEPGSVKRTTAPRTSTTPT